MKTAIYIEEGIVQLVITPENDFEKNALSSFEDKPMECEIFSGTFYDCRGGWTMQSKHYESTMCGGGDHNDRSLILRMAPTTTGA